MYIKLDIKQKAFKDLVVFEDTSIEIDRGSFVAIKGKSGSGKTTLVKMIGCLEAFKGSLQINGEDISFSKRETYRRKYMTYVFQSPTLIPYYSVEENVKMPLKNLKQKGDYEKLIEYAELLGIGDILDKKVSLLSGGEQQRVSILRALLTERPVILADEPTGNLDYLNVSVVMNLLKDICNRYKRTIIMVTHANNLDDYFDKLFMIEDKKIRNKKDD